MLEAKLLKSWACRCYMLSWCCTTLLIVGNARHNLGCCFALPGAHLKSNCRWESFVLDIVSLGSKTAQWPGCTEQTNFMHCGQRLHSSGLIIVARVGLVTVCTYVCFSRRLSRELSTMAAQRQAYTCNPLGKSTHIFGTN